MSKEQYTFDKQSAMRIGRATMEWEHRPRGESPRASSHKFFEDMSYWSMFELEQSAATSIKVHAGYWVRYANGEDFWIELNVDGASVSADPTEYKTLTGITTTCWIIVYLDDPTAPTEMTASTTGLLPVNDDDNVVRVIGKVTCASGVITDVENYHTGIIQNTVANAPNMDGLSLDLNGAASDERGQIYNWDNASAYGSPMGSTSLIPFQLDSTDRYLQYADASMIADWVTAEAPFNWVDLGDTVSSLGNQGELVNVNGSVLDFISTGDLSASLYHTLLQGGAAGDPPVFHPSEFEDNEDHDYHSWMGMEAGTHAGFGQDDKNYETTGYVKAYSFHVLDAVEDNYWDFNEFKVWADGAGTGIVEIKSDGTVDLEAGTNLTLNAPNGIIDIDAGDVIDIDAGDDLQMYSAADTQIWAGATIDIAAATGIAISTSSGDIDITTDDGDFTVNISKWVDLDAAQTIDITSGQSMTLESLIDIGLVPTGDLTINAKVAATLADGANNLFYKGLFVNEDSWTILSGAYFQDVNGEPIGPYKIMVKA